MAHWNYTYLGDGYREAVLLPYREQRIGFRTVSNSSIQPLIKMPGQNGALTLESSIPAPFNGRVEVISSNSTFNTIIQHINFHQTLQ